MPSRPSESPTAPASTSDVAGVDGSGRPGRHNDLTDVAGILVGHHQRRRGAWLTGTTVVLTPAGTVGSVDVRGGGPSTRETDALAPTALVDAVHAVVLSGGSSYGLSAASGVMDWLGERHVGFPVGPGPDEVVPIVAAACLFDLGRGGRFSSRPDAGWGRAAAEAATARRLAQGNFGAGTGARAGALKGGCGAASVVTDHGHTVAALVAVNPGGSVVDPTTGELWGARHLLPGELPGLRRPTAADLRAARAGGFTDLRARRPQASNTTLAVVATDAGLGKGECARLAAVGHDGMARAIRPVHSMTDGDIVFSLATGLRRLPAPSAEGLVAPTETRLVHLGALMAAAADVVTRAIVHAVIAARTAGGTPDYLSRYPSARRSAGPSAP